jgi:sugar/nucleoside kinase (ribokinase family)
MKVLGIGESVIDKVEIAGRQQAMTHVGGPVTIALVVLARLGAQCHYVTSLGPDRTADMIKQLIEAEGMTASYTLQEATKINTMALDGNGQRTKLRSTAEHRPISGVSSQLIREADLIILDRHEPLAFYEVMHYKRPETEVIIDPSTEVSPHTLDMMRCVEHPIVPVETLAHFDSHDVPTALAKLYDVCGKPVVVTLGELGSLIYDGQEIIEVEPVEVAVVDTTGAGDIYRGAYGYGVLQGWSRQRSAAFANAVAGRHCARRGNHSAVPSRQELLELANQRSVLRDIHLDDIHTNVGSKLALQTI